MLDFRTKSPPKSYFGQAEQRRLLMLVLLIGLVIWLSGRVADPKSWNWFLLGQKPAEEEAAPEKPPRDTRLRRAMPVDEALDTFIAQADPPKVNSEPEPPPRVPFYPGVKSDYLSTVKDDNVLLGTESDAWYHLLEVLKLAKADDIERASTGRVGYVQLDEQPKEYRGRIVTVNGTVRRALEMKADKNSFGIEKYYQLWMQPKSGPTSPIVIYALDLPPGFPVGAAVTADCKASGFFFKRWAYMATDDIRTAPLVLAKTVTWIPPPPPPEPVKVQDLWKYILAAFVAAGLVIGAIVISQHNAARRRVAAGAAGPAPNLASLGQADIAPSVEERLRELEGEAGRSE